MKKIINNIKKSLKGTNKKVVIPIIIMIVVVIGVGTYFIPNFNEYQALQTQTKLLGLNYPQTNVLVKDSTIEKMKEDIFNSQQVLKEKEENTKKSSSYNKESKPSNNDKQPNEDTDKGNSSSSSNLTNDNLNNSNNSSSSNSTNNSSSSNSSNISSSSNSGSSSGGNNSNNSSSDSSGGSNSNNNSGGSSSGGNSNSNGGGDTGTTIPQKPSIPSDKKCGYIDKDTALNKSNSYSDHNSNELISGTTEYGYDCISDYSWNGTSWVAQYKYDMPAYVFGYSDGTKYMVMGNGTIYDY